MSLDQHTALSIWPYVQNGQKSQHFSNQMSREASAWVGTAGSVCVGVSGLLTFAMCVVVGGGSYWAVFSVHVAILN